MTDQPKKTYLISLTRAETPQLWLAQTHDVRELITRVVRQCEGMKKGVVWALAMDTLQPNNCMEAKLLEQLAVLPREDYHHYLDEAIRRIHQGRSRADSIPLLESALHYLTNDLNLTKENM